jgi:DNA topoisomerase II
MIKKVEYHSTDTKIDFTIIESENGFTCSINNLGLYSYLHTSNMVLFDEYEKPKKYNFDEIINDFCKVRYEFYFKRKRYIINKLEKDLKHISNKVRFVQENIDKKINIMNVEEEDLIKELEKKGYDKECKNEEGDGGYNYLLSLQARSFTKNKVKQLKNDLENIKIKLDKTIKTNEKQMWLNDLEQFEIEYEKWLEKIEDEEKDCNQKKSKKKSKK